MGILGDIKMYGRFAWGLRGFLQNTITLEEARETVRRRLAERETNFLRLVERGIFGYPRSPYLPLLKMAGCQFGDIQKMVKDRGLEDTLRALREAGVYVTFEEFKGRESIERNGRVIPVEARDFDNPYLSQCYQTESGGSTGAGTRVSIDLEHIASVAYKTMIAFAAHDVLYAPMALWRGILPVGTGISNILETARFASFPLKWFTYTRNKGLRASVKYSLANHYIITLGRMFGAPFPRPEMVSLDQAAVVARWASKTLETHAACLIRAGVSQAVRICVAAREEGLDLTGAAFNGGGEPPTPAKVNQITGAGARWIPNYSFVEAGRIGMGCARPADGNDVHFFSDFLALIQYPRRVPGAVITVDAFCFTTLLATSPKILLNVESDDYGVIENRSCGCPLEAVGFTQHLRHIYSFRKLTGEGVTLVGGEMIHILEEILPARFGGSPLDYQLMEEEDEKGITRLTLLISPKLEIADEKAVIQVVLEAMGRSSVAAESARTIWSQAKTLQIKRIAPILTSRGKLMTLHVAQRSGRLST